MKMKRSVPRSSGESAKKKNVAEKKFRLPKFPIYLYNWLENNWEEYNPIESTGPNLPRP